MKLCIVGAGAVGGFVAALMADDGHEISAVARGAHLAAIREAGLRLDFDGRRIAAPVVASDNPQDLGVQDAVIVAVKAPALPAILPALGPLLGPETPIVVAMNGVPWWMFDGFGAHDGLVLRSVDGDGALARFGSKERLIGCVIHTACEVPEPGLIRHNSQNRFILGEPGGTLSARVNDLVDAMVSAGIGAEATAEIQQEVWIKLLGNLPFAPVSMITGVTNDVMANAPDIRRLMLAMFEEAAMVGKHFGLEPGMTAEARIDLGGSLAGFKTSTRQDFEQGRPVELDVIVNAVREMGDIAGIDTPTIDTVYAIAAQKAALAGLYRYDGGPAEETEAA